MTRRAFTLVELLVVLTIIAVVSAATLPVVLPALAHRQVSESARIVQAAIEGSRDAAIRANAPRGIRLIADPSLPAPLLAFNRILPIEPAPDYSEGRVSIVAGPNPAAATLPLLYAPTARAYPAETLRIEESRENATGAPNARTSWYWNVRIGERIRIGESGAWYTIIGPAKVPPGAGNPEQFVNVGPPGVPSPIVRGGDEVEFLYVVNGLDDDADGVTDSGWDGTGYAAGQLAPGVPGWEAERWHVAHGPGLLDRPYTIERRPVPTQGARFVEMPSNVVIDATTWDTTRERSRLPVDPNTRMVEILISPNGTVILQPSRPGATISGDAPFLHCWIAERGDVLEPATNGSPRLPTDAGLKGDRRLVTVNMRTGNVVTNAVEGFDGSDVHAPFYGPQRGVRGAD
jgi:prepilin-type N-terminal cleavage/methylation domain-containing protein